MNAHQPGFYLNSSQISGFLRNLLLLLGSLLLSACIPDGIRIPESPLLRNLERKSGLIAYVGTDFNIYTVDQGGGNLAAVTEDAQTASTESPSRIYQFPSWSPVDNKLAFVGLTGQIDDISVYTADPDGKDVQIISSHPDELSYYLYWTPDGENISFLAATEGGQNNILKLVPANGGETEVLDTGSPYYWDWAPNARQLVINEGLSTSGRISFLFPGDEVREEGISHEPARFRAPAYSPDGQYLLLAAQNRSGPDELILADQVGRKIRSLATFEHSIAFAWSPDGKKIAYLTQSDPSLPGTIGSLTVLELDRPDEPVLISDRLVNAFFWAPDSEKIAFFEATIPADDGSVGTSQADLFFNLFVKELDKDDQEFILSFIPTTEFFRRVAVFDQYHRSDTIWSPDSRFIVISVIAPSGDPSIWVVPASGNITPRFIADGTIAFWSRK
jgi:Tol biopolymer transport system component